LHDTDGSSARRLQLHGPNDGIITGVDRLLRGLHHVTLTKKLSDLGLRRYSGQSTEDLEFLLATYDKHEGKPRRQVGDFMNPPAEPWDQWELVKDDGKNPPYYRNLVSGEVKWAPGRWRRRRSTRSNVAAHPHGLTFGDAHTSSNDEITDPMLKLLTDLHVDEGDDWKSSRDSNPTDISRLYDMLALVVAAAAAAALFVCRASGALKTRESVPPGTSDAFLCPISLEPMIDPVTVVETGQTYECAAIKSWFYTHSTDPISNVELRSKKLVPNIAVRKMLQTIDEHAATEAHDSLLCPISLELMADPVILVETGQTYDRLTIESWLLTHSTDPITNIELRCKKIVPNIAIRKMVQSRQAECPEQQIRATTVPGPPHLPASRSAWLACIGGGLRKGMSRSESAGRVLDLIGSLSTTGVAASSTSSNMPRRTARSFTDLVGLQTSEGAPVH
jgi:hypothetical protein